MKKQRTILLDLGGVVFQSTGVDSAYINWLVVSQLNEQYGYELNIGRDLFPTFLADYNQLTNQALDAATFLKEIFDTLTINQELIDYLQSIGDIIIVSDNYRENIEYISERYQFSEWAKQQIYSFDYEMVKSNPSFFERLLNELNIPADELIFIDDSPEKLASAARFGVRGVLYQSNEEAIAEVDAILAK